MGSLTVIDTLCCWHQASTHPSAGNDPGANISTKQSKTFKCCDTAYFETGVELGRLFFCEVERWL
jgi:hypothetical protein